MSNDLIVLDGIIEDIKSDIAPEMGGSEFFELLVGEQITKNYELTYEQILDGNLGGSGDGGIDTFHIFVNGMLIEDDTELPKITDDINIHVIISQAKNKTGYEEEAVNKLTAVSEDLFALERNLDEFRDVYNDSLLEIAERFRILYKHYAPKFPSLTITYYYGSRAKNAPTQNIQRKAGMLKKKIEKLFSSSTCEFIFLGASELLDLIRKRRDTTFQLRLAEQPISLYTDGISYIGLVNLKDYFEFITDNTGKLIQHIFESNVRDYQGRNRVNKQILDSLENPQYEDFWWLNNGVTVLSSEAEHRGKEMTIENPEIVNGLQTSRGIYEYFSTLMKSEDFESWDDNRKLLVRVIVPQKEESRGRIILATNSQTQIPIESLSATQEIHRNIETYLLNYGIYYDRRKNHWKQQGKPFSKILTIKKLAQVVMSVAQYKPQVAKSSPSRIFKSSDLYKQVFNDEYHIKLYYVCAKLLMRVESVIRTDAIKTDLNQRSVGQIKFHALTHIAMRVTRIPNAVPNQIAQLEVEIIDEDVIIDSVQKVLDIFVDMGATNNIIKSSDFVSRVIDDAKSIIQ